MSEFPRGYGTAWSEPKAENLIKRFFQIMREPATKTSWLWGLIVVSILLILFFVGLPVLLVLTSG